MRQVTEPASQTWALRGARLEVSLAVLLSPRDRDLASPRGGNAVHVGRPADDQQAGLYGSSCRLRDRQRLDLAEALGDRLGDSASVPKIDS